MLHLVQRRGLLTVAKFSLHYIGCNQKEFVWSSLDFKNVRYLVPKLDVAVFTTKVSLAVAFATKLCGSFHYQSFIGGSATKCSSVMCLLQ